MLSVKIICPKCFKEQSWSGEDFEDWKDCECGFGDEVWFWWHTLEPISTFNYYSSINDLWVRSANYPNDALLLTREEFIDFSLGQGKGMTHGGSYTLRVMQSHYKEDNPNFGSCQADIKFDLWNPSEDTDLKWIIQKTKETNKFCKFLKKKAKAELKGRKKLNNNK
jgi:hypothetical protein